MIGSKIKRGLIKKRLQKLRSSQELKSSETRNGKIQSVGILTTHKLYSKYNLRALVSEFLLTEDTRILYLNPKDKGQNSSPESFSENDLNWRGEIKGERLQSFANHPFELIICFYDKPSAYLDYVACSSAASFMVGFVKKNSDFLDLSVHVTTDEVINFFEELKKYLIILNKL